MKKKRRRKRERERKKKRIKRIEKNWKAIVARGQQKHRCVHSSRSMDPWLRAYLAVRSVGTSAYQLRYSKTRCVVAGVSVWQARRNADGIRKCLSFLRENGLAEASTSFTVFFSPCESYFSNGGTCVGTAHRPPWNSIDAFAFRFLPPACCTRMLLIRRIVWKRWPPFLPSSLSFRVCLEETYVCSLYIGGVVFSSFRCGRLLGNGRLRFTWLRIFVEENFSFRLSWR